MPTIAARFKGWNGRELGTAEIKFARVVPQFVTDGEGNLFERNYIDHAGATAVYVEALLPVVRINKP